MGGRSSPPFSQPNKLSDLARMFFDRVWSLCAQPEAQWMGGVFILAVVALVVAAEWESSVHSGRADALFLTGIGAYVMLPRSGRVAELLG